jgi:hypothetical protein
LHVGVQWGAAQHPFDHHKASTWQPNGNTRLGTYILGLRWGDGQGNGTCQAQWRRIIRNKRKAPENLQTLAEILAKDLVERRRKLFVKNRVAKSRSKHKAASVDAELTRVDVDAELTRVDVDAESTRVDPDEVDDKIATWSFQHKNASIQVDGVQYHTQDFKQLQESRGMQSGVLAKFIIGENKILCWVSSIWWGIVVPPKVVGAPMFRNFGKASRIPKRGHGLALGVGEGGVHEGIKSSPYCLAIY